MNRIYMTGMYNHNGQSSLVHKPVCTLPEVDRYSDEELDRWGEIYTANRLHARGILFETFLRHPQEILAAVVGWVQHIEEDQPSLLPSQRQVVDRLDREELDEELAARSEHALLKHDYRVIEMHGNQYVQPMHSRVPCGKRRTGSGKRRATA